MSLCAATLVFTSAVLSLARSITAREASQSLESTSHTEHNSAEAANQGAKRGRALFVRNCAHCHGEDAKGDEGPSLYDLTLSDARIANRIKDGIKGEMPRFASKFNDAEIAALTAYLRTLKE